MFKFADKMAYFDINIFAKLDERRAQLEAMGRDVINLSIGTPDLPPDEAVLHVLSEASQDPRNLKYSLGDTFELLSAVIGWYRRRYGVHLEEQEITSVYGSQEGLAHIAFPLCNPGDIAIVPTPSYPIFAFGPLLAGAEIYETPLLEENDYLVDFESIPAETARRAKMIIISYPNNPVTATAPPAFYEKLVDWAKTYNVAVVHDNAYSEIVFDGNPGGSFLAVPGAMDVGVEFNSLSKAYNLTGMRIAFAMGNADIIHQFMRIRSQIDYGISFPVQIAAAAALNGPQDVLARNLAEYERRRDALCGGLRSIGWDVKDSPATMFVWTRIPPGFKNSMDFVLALLDQTGVACVPGSSFGKAGEGYVRLALVQPVDVLQEAVQRIAASGILEP